MSNAMRASAGAGGLTEEQKRRIEENRRRAQAKLFQKQQQVRMGIQSTRFANPVSINSPRSGLSGNSNTGSVRPNAFTSISPPSMSNFNRATSGQRPYQTYNAPITSTVTRPSMSSQTLPPRSLEVAFNSNSKPTCIDLKKPGIPVQSPMKSHISGSSKQFYGNRSSAAGSQLSVSRNIASTVNKNCGLSSSNVTNSSTVSSHTCVNNNPKQTLSSRNSSSAVNTANLTAEQVAHTVTQATPMFGQLVMGGCVLVSRERFEVDAGYSMPMVEVFKTMETKIYDPTRRRWSFKLQDHSNLMSALRPLRPNIQIEPLPAAVLQVFSAQCRGVYAERAVRDADLSAVDSSLVNSLMTFQREGVSFGISHGGRLLLADDMGLGKTIQAICLAVYYKDDWPVLVVVPSSVRFDWAEQFRRWVPSLDPQSITVATTGKDNCTGAHINIISYDLMTRKTLELKNKRFQVIIMDESHMMKNCKTARTKAALPILTNARRVILLTGTPALSRPNELYTQVVAVCPRMFKFHDFGIRYCAGKQSPWGWDYSGSSNMGELQLLLEEKIMIRREKKDVLSQLPAKRRQMVLLDPASIKSSRDLQKACKMAERNHLKGSDMRSALLEYFHETARAKISAIRDYITDLVETGRKFLIFAHHQEILDALEETIQNKLNVGFIRIDGRTPSEQRKLSCDRFQANEKVQVALLSITAANAGLHLTAASLVVFAELFWNPGILVQAEDRVHRIGQQDSVNIHYLVAPGTADDQVWPLVQKKLNVLSKAGLVKENFSEADTKHVKDLKHQQQPTLIDYFEESFFEETVPDFEDASQNDLPTPTSPHRQLAPHTAFKPCPSKLIPSQWSPTKWSPRKLSPSKRSPSKQASIMNYVTKPARSISITSENENMTSSHACEGNVGDTGSGNVQLRGDDSDNDILDCLDQEWDDEMDEPQIKKVKR